MCEGRAHLTEVVVRSIDHHAAKNSRFAPSSNGHSSHLRDRSATEVAPTLRKAGQRESCGGVSPDACAQYHAHGGPGTYSWTPHWIRSAQTMAVLHFRTRRVVTRS